MNRSDIMQMAHEYANNMVEHEATGLNKSDQQKAVLYLFLKHAFVAGVKATEGVESHPPHRIQQF
jgi:hypothetical protein